MNLFEIINEEIKKAMLAKDKIRLESLRGIKKEFLEAKTAKGANDQLPDDKAISILHKMVKQRKDSAEIYKTQNREDLASNEIAEINVIQQFLPKQMTQEELETAIKNIIKEENASSMQDMGKIMKAATSSLSGKAEGRAISDTVKKLLN